MYIQLKLQRMELELICTQDKRLSLPALIAKLGTTLDLMFMLHFSTSAACPTAIKPSACHFEGGTFTFTYTSGIKEEILAGIKSCIVTTK
ncbi:MAG: hypothetical protein WC516_05280 [Patescibacteria group bacterium]